MPRTPETRGKRPVKPRLTQPRSFRDDKGPAGSAVCPHCGERCGICNLVASVEIVTRRPHPVTVTEQRLYEAIPQRHTVREPFRHGIPTRLLAELERVARMEKPMPGCCTAGRPGGCSAGSLVSTQSSHRTRCIWPSSASGQAEAPAASVCPMPPSAPSRCLRATLQYGIWASTDRTGAVRGSRGTRN
jgi:hypothetical protein